MSDLMDQSSYLSVLPIREILLLLIGMKGGAACERRRSVYA